MLINLETYSRIMEATVRHCFKPKLPVMDENEEKLASVPVEVQFCDFDKAEFEVLIEPDNLDVMLVSMTLPSFSDIAENGGMEALEQSLGQYISDAKAGFDVTLRVDLNSLPDDYEALIDSLSKMKNTFMQGPYRRYFQAINDGASLSPITYNLDANTIVYFVSKGDRCTVAYSINCREKFDEVLSRTFMGALVEKHKTAVRSSPIVTFDINPPGAVTEGFGIEDPVGNVGFVGFTVLENHVNTEAKLSNVAALLMSYHNYLRYHVKCSKAYFHSKMRARVQELLQILNRAKQNTEEKKKKKTASGRTFTRN
jgi:actin related protein 2/3 complex subunit 2